MAVKYLPVYSWWCSPHYPGHAPTGWHSIFLPSPGISSSPTPFLPSQLLAKGSLNLQAYLFVCKSLRFVHFPPPSSRPLPRHLSSLLLYTKPQTPPRPRKGCLCPSASQSPNCWLLQMGKYKVWGPRKFINFYADWLLVWFKLGNKIEFPDVLFGINLATEKRLLRGGGGNGSFLHSRRWSPKAYGLD